MQPNEANIDAAGFAAVPGRPSAAEHAAAVIAALLDDQGDAESVLALVAGLRRSPPVPPAPPEATGDARIYSEQPAMIYIKLMVYLRSS